MKSIYTFFVSHGTKVLGFAQVTFGALAASTDIFAPRVVKALLIANGLLIAWRGFFNSQQGATP